MAPVPRTYSTNYIENQAGTHPPPTAVNLLTAEKNSAGRMGVWAHSVAATPGVDGETVAAWGIGD